MIENGVTYTFNEDELKALVLMLRRNEDSLPDCLENLKINLQNIIYDSMTIDEAENFFNETIS